MTHRFPSLFRRLGELQAQRPWLFVALAILSLLPAGFAAKGIGFKSDFAELLPDNKPSVIEMRRVSKRLAGASTLSIVAEVPQSNPAALKRFVDEVVPRLKALGPERVGAVDFGVQDARAFFEKNKLFYASYDDLKKAHDEVVERYDYEIAKKQGTLLDDDETEAPPPLTADDIERRLTPKKKEGDKPKDGPPHPDGYYMNAEGTHVAVLVRTPVSGKQATAELKAAVAGVVNDTHPKGFDAGMEVRYTGDIITSAEEYDAIISDLSHVGTWGVAGVLGSVLLFFLRIRTVMVIGAVVLTALLWTFGLTRFTIGYLNSSTGFLVSIIAGNGINYSIMYMARYIEARRDQGMTVPEATLVSWRDTWVPTLSAAATACLAYGSLIVTDFRGFKHFGIIGGYGMLLCWLVTYLFMPAVLAASEGVMPMFKPSEKGERVKARGYYGLAFAKLARLAPRTLTVTGVVLGVASVALAGLYLTREPMEYDMANVRNERKDRTAAGELSKKVDKVVGRLGQDGMAIMTERLDQVLPLKAELEKRLAAAPEKQKPFEKVVTIHSLLPDRQAEKIPLIETIRDRLERARKRGVISDADWVRLEGHMPKGALAPIGIADLPEQVARSFTEKNGTRGNIVFIVPKSGESVWDAKYLIRWADSFRSTPLPSGEVIQGSGRAVIYADMIMTVAEDAPKAIAVSAIGSVVVILVAFGAQRAALGVFLPWLLGVAGLLAFMFLKSIKLNFLNFVTLPITIGIAAEYAHNLMQRYRSEGPDKLYGVVVETGGAVILCSLTTTIGYLALMLSINRGIVSFGLAAAVGEVICVLAAVLFLPAFLFAMQGRKRASR
ncbi:MAG: MMPL family transporter [Polyangiaceae bacterium]|nr:MMPL family transporter [Polyangiaceae bacterium]